MKLYTIFDALKNEVLSERSARLFETARAEEPVLVPFASVAELLSVLGRNDPGAYSSKEMVIRFLVTQHREGREPFWSSLLLVVFGRMLCRLRGRVLTEEFDSDEMDQMVLFAFLTAVKRLHLSDDHRLCMYLRQMTKRWFFAQLKEERRRKERFPVVEPVALYRHASTAWPVRGMNKRMRERRLVHDADDKYAMTEILKLRAGQITDAKKLDLVIATAIEGERLLHYARRLHDDLPPDKLELAYQRLKKQRNRTVAELRAVFY